MLKFWVYFVGGALVVSIRVDPKLFDEAWGQGWRGARLCADEGGHFVGLAADAIQIPSRR